MGFFWDPKSHILNPGIFWIFSEKIPNEKSRAFFYFWDFLEFPGNPGIFNSIGFFWDFYPRRFETIPWGWEFFSRGKSHLWTIAYKFCDFDKKNILSIASKDCMDLVFTRRKASILILPTLHKISPPRRPYYLQIIYPIYQQVSHNHITQNHFRPKCLLGQVFREILERWFPTEGRFRRNKRVKTIIVMFRLKRPQLCFLSFEKIYANNLL